jgi:glycosyltransferase involved in cell wall biosynthesis
MIGVCICTHNRPRELADCMRALAPQLPGRAIRVLIVDSGSDPVALTANRELAAHFGVSFTAVEATGLSIARNRGIELLGDRKWIAFLDDDSIPAETWIDGLGGFLARLSNDYGVVAGRIDPLWPGSQPHIDEVWRQFLSLVQCSEDMLCPVPFRFAGANLVLRREALVSIGGFPIDLDRNGLDLLSGGDTFVVGKIISTGLRYAYSNSFPVAHQISPERLTFTWMKQRALAEGRTEGILMRKNNARTVTFDLVKVATGLARYWIQSMIDERDQASYWQLLIRLQTLKTLLFGMPNRPAGELLGGTNHL